MCEIPITVLDWVKKTLVFVLLGAAAWARSAEVKILLVGDSTVTDVAGWAPGFRLALAPGIDCINASESGRSSKSYRDEGHWAKALATKADYVLIQFGHNDVAGKGPARETDPATTYRENMARYVDEARALGLRPVLVTSLAHRNFGPDGKLKADPVEPYVAVVRELGRQMGVPVIDLYAETRELCARLGREGSERLGRFIPDAQGVPRPDTTHLGRAGALLIGRMVADDLARAVPALAAEILPDPAALPALRLPNPPSDCLPRAQAFDYNITDRERPTLAGKIYFIWGAKSSRQPPGVIASRYLPYARDPDRAHTLEWYKTNHPDWIMFQADRTTPAWGFTYSAGNCMPLDISNPEARAFYFATYVLPAVKEGFPVIALDNAGITNWDHRRGHYDHGKWVETFSGERVDAKYAEAVIDWLEYLRGRLHALGVGVAANIKCYDEPVVAPEALRREVETVDIFCDEGGFTFHRDSDLTGAFWEAKVAFLQQVLPHRLYFSLNSMTGPRAPRPGTGRLTHDAESKKYRSRLADASPRQVEYAIASFLIVREHGSMLGLIGQEEHGSLVDRPELNIDLGVPLAPAVRLSSGAWRRAYRRGLVLVNPSPSTSALLSLPPGQWKTLNRKTVAKSLELGPNSGAVLSSKNF